jgi:hypothetical protein
MRHKWLTFISFVGVLALAFTSLIGQSALAAQPAAGQGPGNHLRILQVNTDPDAGTIKILGEGFDFGPGPLTVSLGTLGDITDLCQVPPPTADTIVCTFTGDVSVEPGDYLLTVADNGGQSQGDEYDLTIGAALNPPSSCPCWDAQLLQLFAETRECQAAEGRDPFCEIEGDQFVFRTSIFFPFDRKARLILEEDAEQGWTCERGSDRDIPNGDENSCHEATGVEAVSSSNLTAGQVESCRDLFLASQLSQSCTVVE